MGMVNYRKDLLLVNHMQGKIYISEICYKRELRFECELQV